MGRMADARKRATEGRRRAAARARGSAGSRSTDAEKAPAERTGVRRTTRCFRPTQPEARSEAARARGASGFGPCRGDPGQSRRHAGGATPPLRATHAPASALPRTSGRWPRQRASEPRRRAQPVVLLGPGAAAARRRGGHRAPRDLLPRPRGVRRRREAGAGDPPRHRDHERAARARVHPRRDQPARPDPARARPAPPARRSARSSMDRAVADRGGADQGAPARPAGGRRLAGAEGQGLADRAAPGGSRAEGRRLHPRRRQARRPPHHPRRPRAAARARACRRFGARPRARAPSRSRTGSRRSDQDGLQHQVDPHQDARAARRDRARGGGRLRRLRPVRRRGA